MSRLLDRIIPARRREAQRQDALELARRNAELDAEIIAFNRGRLDFLVARGDITKEEAARMAYELRPRQIHRTET